MSTTTPTQTQPIILTQTVTSGDTSADIAITFKKRIPAFVITCESTPLDLPAWMEVIRKAAAGKELKEAMQKGNRDTRVNVLKICHMFGYDLPNTSKDEMKEARDWATVHGFLLTYTTQITFEYPNDANNLCTISLKKWKDGDVFTTSITMHTTDQQAVKYFADCIYWSGACDFDVMYVEPVGPNVTKFAKVVIFSDSIHGWQELKLSATPKYRELAKEYQATNLLAYWDAEQAKAEQAKAEHAKAEQAKTNRKHVIQGLKITHDANKTVGTGKLQAYVDAIQKGQIVNEMFADMQTWAEVAAFMGYKGSLATVHEVAKLTNKVLDEDLIKKAEEAGRA